MLFVWRKEMGASYQEMLETPISVIFRDIEMISMENTYSKPIETTKRKAEK